MMFLFTTSQKLGSKLIRWGLDSSISHFAICFDESAEGFGIVFQSTLAKGVHFDWFHSFRKHNQIVYALRPKNLSLDKEEKIYQAVVSECYGRDYDWRAYPEFSYYALRRKFTGRPIPDRSRFASSSDYICTEIGKALRKHCPEYVPNPLPDTLIEPMFLYNNMLQSHELECLSKDSQSLS